MQIGDKVQLNGTIRDVVGEAVLVVTDDNREYWLKAEHLQVTGSQSEAGLEPLQPGRSAPAPEELEETAAAVELPPETAAAVELPPE
jgi:hypothetical protein